MVSKNDMPSRHVDKQIPILDLKMSLADDNELLFQFFEKDTKNDRVILTSSALNERQKRNIFTQEALRRLRNTSKSFGENVQNSHLDKFMLKLKNSGYSEIFRRDIIASAKAAYQKQCKNHELGAKCEAPL